MKELTPEEKTALSILGRSAGARAIEAAGELIGNKNTNPTNECLHLAIAHLELSKLFATLTHIMCGKLDIKHDLMSSYQRDAIKYISSDGIEGYYVSDEWLEGMDDLFKAIVEAENDDGA